MLGVVSWEEWLASPACGWGALALGLIVGSFANVLIHRLPRSQSVVRPRSRCPSCGSSVRLRDNVPVLSYVLLRGRCRDCRNRISPRYPVVEAANGLAYLGLVGAMGPAPRTLIAMALVTALLVLSLIDLEHHILPNAITKPGIAVGLLASFLPGSPVTPKEAILASLGGYWCLFAVAAAYKKARGVEGLGQGDWKMVAMLGAFLGSERTLLTVLIAAAGGTVVGLTLMIARGVTSRHALPLGTFLGFAAILVIFLGDPILAWYRGWYGG